MTTELDGLSSWVGMSSVKQSIEFEEDRFKAVVHRAENQPSIVLGGEGNATVESSFRHHPQPDGNRFSISDIALLRTRSEGLWPWSRHAVVHHMFQDLMCLTYGKPCLSRVVSVKREDDQSYVQDGDSRSTWRDVYEPGFGRRLDGIGSLDRATARPLFAYGDIDPDSLRTWVNQWDLCSRPTWIAVTTMFQRGTTVEARLLQIGVALEALGYAEWTSEGDGTGETPRYPALLELITDGISIDHPDLFGGLTPDRWRASFNRAFKGIKHADNPLPDGNAALRLAQQGMNLIRVWLGRRLGVPDATLSSGLTG